MIKRNIIKKLSILGVALCGALGLSIRSNAYYNNDDIGYNYSVGDYGVNDIYDYSYIGQYKNISWSRNCNYLLKEYLNQNNNEILNYCLGNCSRWFDTGSIIDYDRAMYKDSSSGNYTLDFFSYAYDSSMFTQFNNITKQSESENLNNFYIYTPDNSCFKYEKCGYFEFNQTYTFENFNNYICLDFSFHYSDIDFDAFEYVSGNTKTLTFDNLDKYILILSCDNTYYDFNINNENDKNLINYNISPLSCGFVPNFEYWDAIGFDHNSENDDIKTNLTSWNTWSSSLSDNDYNNHYAVYVKNNRDSALNYENLNTINNLNSQIQTLSNQINDLTTDNSNLRNQVNTLTLSRDSLVNQLATYNNMTYQQIYNLGYSNGESSVSSVNSTIMGLFGAISNVPITILNSVMGPTLLGIPLITILLNFLSVLLILWLIKKLIR